MRDFLSSLPPESHPGLGLSIWSGLPGEASQEFWECREHPEKWVRTESDPWRELDFWRRSGLDGSRPACK